MTASLNAQRRVTRDVASGASAAADLASARVRAERHSGAMRRDERGGDGRGRENRRVRALRFVGAGRGAYDSLGNFVGTGDYDLVLTVSPELDRFARVATSARGGGASASRSRGAARAWTSRWRRRPRRAARCQGADLVLSTGLALVDPALVRGVILRRLETELAPGSRAAALRLRAERRVSADRTYANFAQTTRPAQRLGALARAPSAGTVLESEARVQWQRATQAFAGGASFARARWWTDPGACRLGVAAGHAPARGGHGGGGLLRRRSGRRRSRAIRLGPDLGVSIGPRGRAELSARRAFITGPPAVSVLPARAPRRGAHSAGAVRPEAARVHHLSGCRRG